MSAAVAIPCAVAAVACGGVAAACGVAVQAERIARARRRGRGVGAQAGGNPVAAFESDDRVLRYIERLTRRLFTGDTQPITPSVRAKRAGETRSGARYKEKALVAGCSKDITVSAFCEARTRLTVIGAAVGALVGIAFSTELALLLALAGALGARALPMRSLKRAAQRRAVEAERHLSEMLEVVALGLRSGLTFDRSFALYGLHFDNEFARSCTKVYRMWSLGLTTREEALRDFAASYECDQLSRVVDSIIRSLRFGSALSGILEESAAQSRETYRTALAERVAKAPVKMMLPTGTLILPAMLLLVLGPILLELANGF
ncbi:MAG: type II secretion system F family protein [Eggerthellaceae bacterium]|nr:type II secretion system F family protein [Eggerthellaceae bacterium]